MKAIHKYIIAGLILLTGCAGVETSKLPANEPFDIAVTGDIMMARRLSEVISSRGCAYPFELVRNCFDGSKIVFGNLETALVYEGNETAAEIKGTNSYYFKSDAKCAVAMKYAGFNILSLGNNHILDYGQEGVSQTVRALEEAGIAYCGVVKGNSGGPVEPVIKEVNNTKTGFLSYSNVSPKKFAPGPGTYGTVPGIESVLKRDIKNARDKTDILIIYMHWGKEDEEVKQSQYKLARKIIDMGADMVIGSHTHEFQDVEIYRGKFIFYGLGNFIFDMRGEQYRCSAVLKLNVSDKKITGVKLVPVYLDEYRPRVIKDTNKIYKFLSGIKLINASLSDIYGGMF